MSEIFTQPETTTSSETWPPSPASQAAATEEAVAAPRGSLGRNLGFIAYAVFITTMAQSGVLGGLPIRLLLKNHLHVSRTGLAGFVFITGLAWYIKPLFGLITDAYPLFGTRRRWYMIGSALLAAGSWGVISLGQQHYNTLLYATILLGIFMVVASTIMGALLVEAGQAFGATGRVSSVREFVSGGCSLIAGPLGGWLAGRAFGLTAGIGAGLLISLAAAAFFLLREPPTARRNLDVWSEAGQQIRRALGSRTLWAAAGLLVLFFFSPGFQTPLLYRQQDMLHFSDQFLGYLQLASGGAAMLGAAAYGLVCRFFNLRLLLFVGIGISAVASLLYVSYHPTHNEAIAIEMTNGFFATFGVLPLYDLATRATPRGGEGMGYALMMSARNVAVFGADWVGSKLLDAHALHWNGLVLLSAGTTALCVVAVPFLPGLLMRHREGEDMGEANVTGEQVSAVEPGAGPKAL